MRNARIWLSRLLSQPQIALVLPIILVLGFLLRFAGNHYGLPLTLVDDEPPFTFAALKMLELKTLLPILHPADFKPILYYPPYLSYLYLLPFTLITGIQYFLWSGSPAFFSSHLLTNLSAYFMTARLFNEILGTLSLFLIYKTAESIFKSRIAGLAAAFFLATSSLHIALSMIGRHWLPSSFLLLCILFILSRDWHEEKKYFYAIIVAGFGMGFSMIMSLSFGLIALWYFATSSLSLKHMLSSKKLWSAAVIAAFLVVLPFFLHAKSNGIVLDMTYLNHKSLVDFFRAPFTAWSLTFFSEPVILLLAGLGLFLGRTKERAYAVVTALFFLFYVYSLFFIFRFEPRFMLPLVLLYALWSGYAISRIYEEGWGRYAIGIALLIPLYSAFQLSILAYHGDTRTQARDWAVSTLAPDTHILVFARLTRLPTNAAAVKELRDIDPSALRRIDVADETLNDPKSLHTLNLFTISSNQTFFDALPAYAQIHHYEYLLYSRSFAAENPASQSGLNALIETATPVAYWHGLEHDTSVAESAFLAWNSGLLEGMSLGPDIVIYKLNTP